MMNIESIKGRRLPDTDDIDSIVGSMEKGDYVKYKDGWWCVLPNGNFCDISRWIIVENEDRTITVTPSINSLGVDGWHGYLTNGEFKSC